MSCFIVPMVQALATSACRCCSRKSSGSGNVFKSALPALEKMLWGATLVLVTDHIANGELTFRFPFFTALGKTGGWEQMLHEMFTVGVPMSIVVTAVWALSVLLKSRTASRHGQMLVLPLALCLSTGLEAQEYVESCPEAQPLVSIRPDRTVLLYPEGQAAGKGIVEDGVIVTYGPQEDNGLRGPETCTKSGSRKNVGDDARIDLYFPKECNGQMVIITPGGGYSHLSSFNEGSYGAKWLTDRGVAACVLKYRLPNKHSTVPLDDLQNAMRYCRYHAREWGVRQIGVMGGSAGGHLSSWASVCYVDEITRPDFAVLLYPRISLYKGETTSTKCNLIGNDEEWADRPEEHARKLEYYSPDTHVTSHTSPTFIVLSVDDASVNPRNYLPYYIKLTECGVPVEVHIFPSGGHGWGQSSEEIVGKGKDKFARYRPEFDLLLTRWLDEQLEKACL